MNIDPLADISPARHIIESDDEDDSPLFEVTASGDSEPPTTAIRIEGQLTPTRTLVFATGKAASHWARGAGFGEQIGVIILNDMQVGLTFKPSWTDAAVVISELFVRLPLWAMHPYVEAILEAIQPERVFVLDIYPTHTYITSAPSPLRTASIRYLTGEAVSTIVILLLRFLLPTSFKEHQPPCF
ncbi:hypothetical protein BDN72DRAFT_62943 [Pluteus cervinus]|uniref:Uncharacterized protein n=1 Tax=Pluteus cervinus TaxID=181527 RepID=A0ACD3AQP3_9AGAR|nr:hypothetical protein BDN72DRAFT_62943 [Pluteus cervinus]